MLFRAQVTSARTDVRQVVLLSSMFGLERLGLAEVGKRTEADLDVSAAQG